MDTRPPPDDLRFAEPGAPLAPTARSLVDDHTRAFIDLIIDVAVERCMHPRGWTAIESRAMRGCPRNDNTNPG